MSMMTLEQIKALAVLDPEQLLKIVNESIDENSSNTDDGVEDYDDDYDDDDYYDDDYDDDDYDEDDNEWGMHKCVVVSTSSRVSIYVDGASFAFFINEVPSTIAELVKTMLKSDTEVFINDAELELLKSANIPKLAKLINKVSDGAIVIDSNGKIWLDGDEINKKSIEHLLEMAESNNISGIQGYAKFQRSLQSSPSATVISRLYDFLKCASIEINEDGRVLAYKAINSDYYDCYTGSTYLNTEGSTISMTRNKVNDDDSITCSFGLHVCSISYLTNFYWNDGKRLALVSIHPEDFVSIPVDYDDAKARVCEYKVEKVYTIEEAEQILDKTFSQQDDPEDYVDLSNFM